MTPQTIDRDRPAARCVGVTVRTPAGMSSAFAVEEDDTAEQLTERSVEYFVAHDQLEPGTFRLGLVRGGSIVDLSGEVLLFVEGVVEGDVLHLLSTEPQVDGNTGQPTSPHSVRQSAPPSPGRLAQLAEHAARPTPRDPAAQSAWGQR